VAAKENKMKFRRVQLAREAGDITRFHTARMIHDETVGHHSFNLINLLLIMTDGQATKSLILAALCHDLGELATGDIPANVKSKMDEPLLKRLRAMEDEVVNNIHPELPQYLSSEDEDLLSLADRLDGLLKCIDEVTLGNHHIVHIGDRYCAYLTEMLENTDYDDHRELVEQTINYFREITA
jgi:5'-deoxynucleotidase YfbR-like HD superfamily hydrolase